MEIEEIQNKQIFQQSLFLIGILSCYEEVIFEMKTTNEKDYLFIITIGKDENIIQWNDIIRLKPNEITSEEIVNQMNNYLLDIEIFLKEWSVLNTCRLGRFTL